MFNFDLLALFYGANVRLREKPCVLPTQLWNNKKTGYANHRIATNLLLLLLIISLFSLVLRSIRKSISGWYGFVRIKKTHSFRDTGLHLVQKADKLSCRK